MSSQLTNHIMMVRPASFGFNQETADNNAFQSEAQHTSDADVAAMALAEFDRAVVALRGRGVKVTVIEDTPSPAKPDAIFPNNWVSFHQPGVVITYPMFAANRRVERSEAIIDSIVPAYRRYAFEYYEEDGLFLEGTGSLILDRINKIAYASLSERTDIRLLDKWCVLMKYKQVSFRAEDENGLPIYHTNVIMALGSDLAIICLECMPVEAEREAIVAELEASGKTIIDISLDQVKAYAGNMLQVLDGSGQPLLVMSSQARSSMTDEQMHTILQRSDVVDIDIPAIEQIGGGSIRCMMAEVF